MRDIDGLVIGGPRDFDRFREDLEGQDGLVFAGTPARTPGDSRSGARGDAEGDGARVGADSDGDGAALEPLRDAIEKYRPRNALVLSPYRGMSSDVARLTENGVDVRTAGPLPASFRGCRPPITETHRSDPGFSAMLEASRHADFGDPVYLRMISSPEGGKWQRWWRVFQMCRKAAALLDTPLRRVYVAAAGKAPRLHVSITLKTLRNSTGHLLVAPSGAGLQDDLFFLGTGGTLSDDPLLNQPGMYGQMNYHMLSRPARWRLADLWRDDAVVSMTGDEQRFYQDLLRAIGDSSRSGSGVSLEYPAA